MRTTTCLLVLGLVLGTGCKGEGKPGEGSGSPPAGPAQTAAKLTKAQLEEAKKLVKPFSPWNDTLGKVTAKLGEPHGKDGDGVYWRAIEGDKCAKLSMNKKGEEVGTAGILEYDKAMKSLWDKCAGGG